MNVYDGKHWNIYDILPYQRNFNLINGERSLGKTYTTQMYVIDKCIKNNSEFIYITRTQNEIKDGAFKLGFDKVLMKEFPDMEIEFNINECFICEEPKRLLGYCIALTEAAKIKKRSYPNVKYIIFDEYMIEENASIRYINGWKEPDLFLSIYHTVDREEDRVICFMLGNNTKFYNPYHMHKAFNIPKIKRGGIWTSENVLFNWAIGSKTLKDDKSKSKFIKMLEGTNYGNYAVNGAYVYDSESFIEPLTISARYNFTLEYMGNQFGVYSDAKGGKIYINDKADPSCRLIYALTLSDHTENTLLTHSKNNTYLKWLADNFKNGNVRFTSQIIKTLCEKGIALLL